jgi:hypothetical protein
MKPDPLHFTQCFGIKADKDDLNENPRDQLREQFPEV